MRKWRLPALIIVIAFCAVGCKSSASTNSAVSAAPGADAQTASGQASASCSENCSVSGEGETVHVTLRLAPEVLAPEPEVTSNGLSRRGCPQSHVATVLGVELASSNGCIIGKVVKGGPAERAGLQPGDSIVGCNGGEVECPSTLDPWLFCGKEPGLVELTVRRPTGAGESCGGAASNSHGTDKKAPG